MYKQKQHHSANGQWLPAGGGPRFARTSLSSSMQESDVEWLVKGILKGNRRIMRWFAKIWRIALRWKRRRNGLPLRDFIFSCHGRCSHLQHACGHTGLGTLSRLLPLFLPRFLYRLSTSLLLQRYFSRLHNADGTAVTKCRLLHRSG